MKKIRVAAVSYLNTKPLLYGIKNHPVLDRIELVEDYPSKIAQLLIEDKIDVGLIPVAATIQLRQWKTITNYCIGSNGTVASVCLFSDVPLDKVQRVLLDYQSLTSVKLAKILLKEYWKKEVEFIEAGGEDFRSEIRGNTAGVVIGDRALEQRKKSAFIYDLGDSWKKYTGLAFVFAAWIANKELPQDFERAFNDANAFGLQNIEKVIQSTHSEWYDLREYYTNCVSYDFDEQKRRGMELFLEKLKDY